MSSGVGVHTHEHVILVLLQLNHHVKITRLKARVKVELVLDGEHFIRVHSCESSWCLWVRKNTLRELGELELVRWGTWLAQLAALGSL